MTKYIIEGGVNFYNELYKSLDDDESNEPEENVCLITSQPLVDKFVLMNCGHKFNYVPLYQYIKINKEKYNDMEHKSNRLNKNELRCPYCRQTQAGVLPYYEDLMLPKINGVNNTTPNASPPNITHLCDHLTPNPKFDPTTESPEYTNVVNQGNCKFIKCFYVGQQLNIPSNYTENGYSDTKYYCHKHKKLYIKKYSTYLLNKAKEVLKMEALKAKEAAKEAAKASQKGCITILKTGLKKGSMCDCKVFNENMCKRHYKLQTI
jgi:hypothetical protein